MDVIFDANPAPAPPEPNDEDYEDKLIEQEDLCAHGIISAMKTDTGEDYAIFLVPKLVRSLFPSLSFPSRILSFLCAPFVAAQGNI